MTVQGRLQPKGETALLARCCLYLRLSGVDEAIRDGCSGLCTRPPKCWAACWCPTWPKKSATTVYEKKAAVKQHRTEEEGMNSESGSRDVAAASGGA